MIKKHQFSHKISVFQDRRLPEDGMLLVGYSALIAAYDLQVPLPEHLSAISKKHKKYQKNGWMIFTPRYTPDDSLYGHLIFSLKHEGVNLSILKALFDKIDVQEVIDIIHLQPTSTYSRRIWFLYEWLQRIKLAIPDAHKGKMIDVLDSAKQYPGLSKVSKRHRVNNNLPGVPAFCPIIYKTEKLEELIHMNLAEKAREVLGNVHPDILIRAAAFMLLKDSKASFAIEHETPQQARAERWGQAIAQAGNQALSHDEFLRLQQIIISDFRFVHLGYRSQGGFVGEHERSNRFVNSILTSRKWRFIKKSKTKGIQCTNR